MKQHDREHAEPAPGTGLSPGAHLVTRRPGYAHHGIYVGNGRVIHYAGLSRSLGRGPVEVISTDRFSGGFGFCIVDHACLQFSEAEIVRRAASRVGERRYRLLSNNCEHFCFWCLFGEEKSEQVDACLRNPVHALIVLCTMLRYFAGREWRAMSTRFAERQTSALQSLPCHS